MLTLSNDVIEQTEHSSNAAILGKLRHLKQLEAAGKLGGVVMPEDANPNLQPQSKAAALYFTLPMALNYQRNSYQLWQAALQTFMDSDTSFVFDPEWVSSASPEELRVRLVRYRLALQPNKHTDTWQRISRSIYALFEGDIRRLFQQTGFSVRAILKLVQVDHKSGFPYLSGGKICPYWLYVIERYCGIRWLDREMLSVAPDTHVIQSSVALGLVTPSGSPGPRQQAAVATAWADLLRGTEFVPIDVHTVLWLWSRAGFPNE